MTASTLAAFPDDLAPVSTHVGPFPLREFLAAAEAAIPSTTRDIEVTTVDGGAVAMTIEDGVVRFAAPETLTDYHVPLGPAAADAVEVALGNVEAHRFALDSMPADTCDLVCSVLDRIGARYEVVQHAATGVLALPTDYESWLASISKKERHEVRRKRRRFIANHGEYEIVEAPTERIADFCDLHRSSHGRKGNFMTEAIQSFFTVLVEEVGASIHELRVGDRVFASAFGFVTDDGYYYYNSAYDSDSSADSPGAVLLGAMIEREIERGATVFDFLKGAEGYKYRHGAVERPLFVAEGALP